MTRALAVSALLLTACTAGEPEVEFVATRLTEAEWRSWSRPGVESAHRHITVRRTMKTRSWCRHLDAEVVRTGRELILRVTSTESAGPCPPGEGLWGYMALIQNLAPGRYRLEVIHTYATAGKAPELVLRHQVVVE